MEHAKVKKSRFELIASIPVSNVVGEGVVWNAEDGAVWWTDIQTSKLYRYHLETESLKSWSTPERVGSFSFIENDNRLIVAFASGFAYYCLETGEVEWISRPEKNILGNRFNDGRVDRQGRFWAGTMVEDFSQSRKPGALYSVDSDGQTQCHVENIHISNGLCWSVDSSLVYHADSPKNAIYVYDFDKEEKRLSNRRLFAACEEHCSPDGAIIDSEDYMFSAHWGGWQVVRYTPDGAVDCVLDMPVSQPTCVAFGGKNMDILFVASANENLSADELQRQPQAGNLFIYQTDFKGLKEPFFNSSVVYC